MAYGEDEPTLDMDGYAIRGLEAFMIARVDGSYTDVGWIADFELPECFYHPECRRPPACLSKHQE